MNAVWGIVASIGIAPVLTAGVLVGLLLHIRRLEYGGLGLLARRRFRRNARPARARVLDAVSRSSTWSGVAYQDYTVVLEVLGNDEPGERVQMKLRWNWEKWHFLTAGVELPVLVSPDFPDRVLPDYTALRQERSEAQRREREADEERQRRLLDRTL